MKLLETCKAEKFWLFWTSVFYHIPHFLDAYMLYVMIKEFCFYVFRLIILKKSPLKL